MDAFTALGIIVTVTGMFAVPIFGIVILIALHLADCRVALRHTTTTVNVLIVGEDAATPAAAAQLAMRESARGQTVRVIDPKSNVSTIYQLGQPVDAAIVPARLSRPAQRRIEARRDWR